MYAAIGGLKTHMTNLNVIGNNIANVNTTAYKAQRMIFQESLYTTRRAGSNGTATRGGNTPSQIGYGSQVGSIDLNMAPGTFNPTGYGLDCMIDGDGFFMVGDKDMVFDTGDDYSKAMLTRAGDFDIDPKGYVVDGQGNVVYGFKMVYNPDYQEGATEQQILEAKQNGRNIQDELILSTQLVPLRIPLAAAEPTEANGGIVNTICANIGLTDFLRNMGLVSTSYIPFLSAPGWAHVMIILINIWIGVPYQMLIATGVLMNLPTEQLESARVDGANKFQIFQKITMPYMLFVTGPALVTDFVKNINNFNVIYLLTENVYTTTNQVMANSQAKEVDLLVTWLFRLTQDYYNYKMASAIGIIVFIICAVFTLIAFNRMIKGDKEGTYQ